MNARVIKAYTEMKGKQQVEMSLPWHKAKQVVAAKFVERKAHKK